MSHEPPIPDAARSPYPLQPRPAAGLSAAETESDRSQGTRKPEYGDEPSLNGGGESLVDRARDTFDRVKDSKYALGAAIGIGSAAVLAAVLYARRGSKASRSATEAANRRRQTSKAEPGDDRAPRKGDQKRSASRPPKQSAAESEASA